MPSIGGGSSGFSVSARERDGVLIVAVRGEIDAETTPALARDFELAAKSEEPLVVDLCGTTFMDSAGLYALLVLRRRVAARSRRMVLALWPDGAVATILAVAGVADLFVVRPDRAAAVEEITRMG